MKTVTLLLFLVAATAAAFPDERRQTPAETLQMCTMAVETAPSPPIFSDLCVMYLEQLTFGIFGNITKACVQDCAGKLCTFYAKLGNETIIKACSDGLTEGCASPAVNLPVTCAGSAAAVVPALLGMTVLLSALFGLF